MRGCVIAVLAVLCLALAGPASAAAPPPGATWTEEYFETPDGETLHADVLRPEGLAPDVKTPVILTVSPYTNHSGQPLTPDPEGGPSSRFYDFLEVGQVFEKGYTYVMVDLRGTGGSSGCNDWGGPGEQSDVKAAVEWAASREWSTGKVALYGKSYDAWTGLMALAQRPEGLAAVVSQEPVVDGYRYLYMNRVPFPNRATTPALFQVIDAQPGHPLDDPQYQINSAPTNPACYPQNLSDQQDPDPESDFWMPRDLVDAVEGNTTPTFMMAGYLEDNTKPDAVFELWNNLSGPNQAWFGQWDHIRGTDRGDDGKALAGRETFATEVMAFLDHHVKGDASAQPQPGVTVQTSDGSWRLEQSWPPADSTGFATGLRGGTYVDDGGNDGTCDRNEEGECAGTVGDGIWSISQPLDQTAHLAGTPQLSVNATPGDANLVADVYDIGPDRMATLVSRGATLTPGSGTTQLELYGEDWRFEPGHRIGVLLTDANDEWWDHESSDEEVTLSGASIELPFLPAPRAANLEGEASAKLEAYREEAPFEVEQGTIDSSATTFAVPRSQGVGAGGGGSGSGAGAARGGSNAGAATPVPRARSGRVTVRLASRGKRLIATGRAPSGARVAVGLRRDGKRVARRAARARGGRFRVTFRPRTKGAFRARASAPQDGRTLRARSAWLRR